MLLLYDALQNMDAADLEIVGRTLGSELGEQFHMTAQPLATLTQIAKVYDELVERLMSSVKLSPVVETAKKYIAQHYAEADLGLNAVADALGVHPAYLSRLMKQELGMPFAKYLTHMRINRAVQLMRDPNVRIWQVAERVGYSGGNYFSTAFKKVLGDVYKRQAPTSPRRMPDARRTCTSSAWTACRRRTAAFAASWTAA